MRLACLLLATTLCCAADWRTITPKADFQGWQKVGDGVWTVMSDGTLVGQREVESTLRDKARLAELLEPKRFNEWLHTQAWLFTEQEYGAFDLEFDYWLRMNGNSGIAIHDPSRGAAAIGPKPDFTKTPARIAYEIQLNNQYPDPHPSGSIYNVVDAAKGAQRDNEWNKMLIEVRPDVIRVRVNGKVVAEHAPVPGRPARGPIGLQLHDQFSVAMFRNIRIRER